MPHDIEAMIEEKGLTAPRVTKEKIKGLIQDARYYVLSGTMITICVLTLENGYTVTGESACVSPENFNDEVGRQVAFENAFDKIWPLEDYLLKTKLWVGHPEFVARVCHEINRAYCKALGDDSQPAWDDAPQWQRDSAITGVLFHMDNPEAKASASHDSWMAEKVATGWVYGETKDPEKKTHPCMVPFDQLPVDQQAKDYIFKSVVHELA